MKQDSTLCFGERTQYKNCIIKKCEGMFVNQQFQQKLATKKIFTEDLMMVGTSELPQLGLESENKTDRSSNDINPSKARILKAFENRFIQSDESKGKLNV
jgi:hypothetical protein